jgi:hypothetical protein
MIFSDAQLLATIAAILIVAILALMRQRGTDGGQSIFDLLKRCEERGEQLQRDLIDCLKNDGSQLTTLESLAKQRAALQAQLKRVNEDIAAAGGQSRAGADLLTQADMLQSEISTIERKIDAHQMTEV